MCLHVGKTGVVLNEIDKKIENTETERALNPRSRGRKVPRRGPKHGNETEYCRQRRAIGGS